MALIAAAELKVCANPMEGLDPKFFEEVLGLSEKGLHDLVIMSLGFIETQLMIFWHLLQSQTAINEFSIKIN